MDQRTVENIVEISFAFISLAKSKMLRLPDDGTASAILKEEILSWSEESKQGTGITGITWKVSVDLPMVNSKKRDGSWRTRGSHTCTGMPATIKGGTNAS